MPSKRRKLRPSLPKAVRHRNSLYHRGFSGAWEAGHETPAFGGNAPRIFRETIYFIGRGQQLGTAVEFGTALENELNKDRKKQIDKIRVGFVPMPRARLLSALEKVSAISSWRT